MPTTRRFFDQDTTAIKNDYIDNICADPSFLCNNKQICLDNSVFHESIDSINKICENVIKGNTCENEIDECTVIVKNTITDSRDTLITSFLNIIIPIKNAVDEVGNQKFLRLPPLSSSKKPGEDEICNSCACVDRFAKSPGDSDTDYTSPGQDQCIFDNNFEYFYYPIEIEHINNKLIGEPEVYVGNYKVLSKNIIYSNNNEDLSPPNLYDILLDNGINKTIAYNFIEGVLYKNNNAKFKELGVHLINKSETIKSNNKNKVFYKNVISFYIIFIVFILLIIFNVSN